MTAIKAWMGLKLDKIGPEYAELATLERLKKSGWFEIKQDLTWVYGVSCS